MIKKQLKLGVLFSYSLIFFNLVYGIFFIPFLIKKLGTSEVGIYRIISSLISSVLILDLGIGSTVLRYSAKFYAKKDKRGMSNFGAMAIIIAIILSLFLTGIGIYIYIHLEQFYGNSFNYIEMKKAIELFKIFIFILMLSPFEKVLFGIIAGNERYICANGIKVIRISLKLILSILLINIFSSAIVLLLIEVFLLISSTLFYSFYIYKYMNIKIYLYKWDLLLFKESVVYTLLVFIQSLMVQVNGNIDNMVIGYYIGASAVSIYSIGLQFNSLYEQFAMAISNLILPTISRKIQEGITVAELENIIIRIGRLQLIALGGGLGIYYTLGKEFIMLWLGEKFIFAWSVGLFLMIPTTVPLIQNTCLAILRAKNKLQFRTFIMTCMAIINLVITIVGVRLYGPIAACVGTAIGIVMANIIAMNIYYYKILHFNIFKIFKNILSKIWACCIFSIFCIKGINFLFYDNILLWIIKVVIFILIYIITLYKFGLNKDEKEIIFNLLKKEKKWE